MNQLGINPLDHLLRTTGIWSFNFLLLTLSVTPTRRLGTMSMRWLNIRAGRRMGDWNFLFKLRRILGLFCFVYAATHVSIYLWLDVGFDWDSLWDDIRQKRYIVAGWIGFSILVPLAATSSNLAMRLLKGNWRRLHRMIYALAIAAALHFLWLSKVGSYDARWYTVGVVILLSYRVVALIDWLLPYDDGMEVSERPREAKQDQPPKSDSST
ncbi:MAG: ferric reductase-like transmembrane domain-containing protein [Pseudomonadota bacterium]